MLVEVVTYQRGKDVDVRKVGPGVKASKISLEVAIGVLVGGFVYNWLYRRSAEPAEVE